MEMENECEKPEVVVAIAGIASPVPDSTFQFPDNMRIEVKMALVACWKVEDNSKW